MGTRTRQRSCLTSNSKPSYRKYQKANDFLVLLQNDSIPEIFQAQIDYSHTELQTTLIGQGTTFHVKIIL